jgi:aminoglycoside 6'-N-acetyltransferase
MNILRQHSIKIQEEKITLRPLTESDWELLLKWNSDPEILYYSEGDEVTSYTLEQVQQIYRGVSKSAFCFIIEFDRKPVGECWLQKMNLDRITQKYPDLDCRRIDLMIGEKEYWGRGIGTKVIHLLTRFGFEDENAVMIFGCDIADYNLASLKAFQKAGFEIDGKIEQPKESKARYCYDVCLRIPKTLK